MRTALFLASLLATAFLARADVNDLGEIEVTFYGNGGTPVKQTETYATNGVYEVLPEVEWTGHQFQGWWGTNGTTEVRIETNSAVLNVERFDARWSTNAYTVAFDSSGGEGEMAPIACTYDVETNLPPCTFTCGELSFSGWSKTKDSRLVTYADGAKIKNLSSETNGVATLYAVWHNPRADIDKPISYSEKPWSASIAADFNGYLVDTNSLHAVGTLALKVARRKLLSTGAYSVTVRGTLTLMGQKAVTLKGTMASDGQVTFTGYEDMVLKLDERGFFGTYGERKLIGARNLFRADDIRCLTRAASALDKWQGTWRLVLETVSADGDGLELANGYSTLSIDVGRFGVVKVRGYLGDGTGVSLTTQFLVGDEYCRIPICAPLYKNKAGGFSFVLQFSDEGGCELLGLSDWDASCAARERCRFTASWTPLALEDEPQDLDTLCDFSVSSAPSEIGECEVAEEPLPNGVTITVESTGRWTMPDVGTVEIDKETGEVQVSGDSPAALRLVHTRATGCFTGGFRFYGKRQFKVYYRLFRWYAAVKGIMVGNKGFGTAVVDGQFSMPVVIEGEE